MAKETQTKKRKASAPEADIAKVKKVKKSDVPVPEVQAKKRKAVEEAAPPAVKKSKTPKSTEVAPKPKPAKKEKAKPAEKTSDDIVPETISKAPKKVNGAGATKKKAAKEVISTESVFDNEDEEHVDDESDSDSEIDDQTEALLKGFESDDEEEMVADKGLKEGEEVPKIKLSKSQKKQLEQIKNDESPGVVYVGRIPHGFYENEMKQYFKQFGTIINIRLSRNRKTGASKHYAFIQFESKTVADIVAKTMDNYLLFGHILKVKTVADEQLSPELWKGANKRFKKVPWNKLEGRQLNQGASEEKWEQRITKEQERRSAKADKLKAIGYEFEAPEIKSAKGVAKVPEITNEEAKAIEEVVEDIVKVVIPETVEATESPLDTIVADAPGLEESVEAIETVITENPKKKGKKGKAVKEVEIGAVEVEVEAPVVEETVQPKPKKERKAKAVKAVVAEKIEVEAELPVEDPKPKKGKKGKSVKAVVETITAEEIEDEAPLPVEETAKPKGKKEKKPKVTKAVVEKVVEETEVEVAAKETAKPKSKKEKKAKAVVKTAVAEVETAISEVDTAIAEVDSAVAEVESAVAEVEAAIAEVGIVPVPVEEVTKPKAKRGKKQKAEEVIVEVETAPAAVEEATKPKAKRGKKQKAEAVVAEVEVIAEAPAVEVPEKTLKTKKSKTSLAEKTILPGDAVVEKVAKKGKKAKKETS